MQHKTPTKAYFYALLVHVIMVKWSGEGDIMDNKDDLIIHEYLIKYDIEDDYFNVWKETRESYMYLKELKEIYFNFIEIEKLVDSSLEKRKKYKRNILDLLDEYEKLDFHTLKEFNQTIVKDGNIEVRENHDYKINLGDFISHLDNFIKLKERIDSLQNDVLMHMCNQYNDILEKLCYEDDNLSLDYIIKMNDIIMYKHFDIHTDLDRIDTIELDINKKSKLWRNLKKEERDMLPYYIKATNYDYILMKRRKLFKYYSETLIETIKLKAIYDEENELRKYNKSIKVLTILNILIALIGIFRG